MEDVSPAIDSGCFSVGSRVDELLASLYSLLAMKSAKLENVGRARTSRFVNEMREKVSELPLTSIIHGGEKSLKEAEHALSLTLPPFKLHLRMPQKEIAAEKRHVNESGVRLHSLAEALERGLRRGATERLSPRVHVIAPRSDSEPYLNASIIESCDEWHKSIHTTSMASSDQQRNRLWRQLRFPEIILLSRTSSTARV